MQNQLAVATAYLAKTDPKLAELIAKHGPCPLKPHQRYYQELVESIIGQQISTKAAASITKRFIGLFGGNFPTPEQILVKPLDELRSAGLSNAKAAYVHDLARHIVEGTLDIKHLPGLSNEEIINELTAVKGIGEWTAHMFLIFSLGRLDVLPTGDLGFRVGMQKIYKLKNPPTPKEATELAQKHKWAPYHSVAAWYIWKSVDNS